MLAKVVAQLKRGSIKNVVPYGSPLPTGRYVVVRQENAGANLSRFRVVPHMEQGAQAALSAYAFTELSTLLSGFESADANGNKFKLEEPAAREWQGVTNEQSAPSSQG